MLPWGWLQPLLSTSQPPAGPNHLPLSSDLLQWSPKRSPHSVPAHLLPVLSGGARITLLKHEPFHVQPQLWTRHGSPHILSLQAQITKKKKQKGNALERPNIAIFFSFPQESLFCFFWVHPKIYSSKAGRSGEFISTVTMRSTQETISPDAVSRLKVN